MMMSNRYIKLSFTNGKLFQKSNKTKDFVINIGLTTKGELTLKGSKRADETLTSFKEPITVHQISNMLHTLVGERPVPSFRYVFYDKDESIFNLALNSYIKISSPKIKIMKGDMEIETFIPETVKLGKSPYNSWAKPSTIHWFKIKKYMGDDFNGFVDVLTEVLGYDPTKQKFVELANLKSKLGDSINPVIEYLTPKKKTPIINFLTKSDFDYSEITKSTVLGETVTAGVDVAFFLDGEILVPYNDDFANKIIKPNTNILDGGYVEIVGIFDEYELYDVDDYVAVSTISDEKI
jgi:hypothetical protein